MIYYEGDYRDEREVDETLHRDAMLFRAQCLWRDYESLMSIPHSKRSEYGLLHEIDVLEANLKAMGAFTVEQ